MCRSYYIFEIIELFFPFRLLREVWSEKCGMKKKLKVLTFELFDRPEFEVAKTSYDFCSYNPIFHFMCIAKQNIHKRNTIGVIQSRICTCSIT